MHLGHLDICFAVKNLPASLDFYQKLGFVVADGELKDGYVIVSQDQTRIGLYEYDAPNMLNFRGADLAKVADYLRSQGLPDVPNPENEADGSTGFSIKDPDGNLIYFNTLSGHDPSPGA